MLGFLDISKSFRKMHNTPILLTAWHLPTFLVRIVLPLPELSQKFISRNCSIRISV